MASLAVPLIQLYTSSGPSSLNQAFSQFMEYKTRVPVCGAILLSEDWTEVRTIIRSNYASHGLEQFANDAQCVLVKGWGKGASWTFPKGKINKNEDQRDCALREVLEETGFDAHDLLPKDSKDFFELTDREQKSRLYVVPGVPRDTKFETRTRREISRIEWFKLGDLPTAKNPKVPSSELGGRFYRVTPFMMRLRRWIQANKRSHPKRPNQQSPMPGHKDSGTSVNMDELFGTATPPPKPAGTQKPGLIALPPSAMRQLSSNKMKQPKDDVSAPPTRSSAPELANSKSSDDSKQQLLLSLLHGSHPLPAPPPSDQQPRIDGSAALRALLGAHSKRSEPSNPTQSQTHNTNSLLSLLQASKPPPKEPVETHPMPYLRSPTSTGMQSLTPGSSVDKQSSNDREQHVANRLPSLIVGPNGSSGPSQPESKPDLPIVTGSTPTSVPPAQTPAPATTTPFNPVSRPGMFPFSHTMIQSSPSSWSGNSYIPQPQNAPVPTSGAVSSTLADATTSAVPTAPAAPSNRQQQALLSALLGSSKPQATSAHSTPSSPAVRTFSSHASNMPAPANVPQGPCNAPLPAPVTTPAPIPSDSGNAMNLLNILNRPPTSTPMRDSHAPASAAVPTSGAQNTSNSLLATLLHGKRP